jgi:phosphoglycolate phosphatase
MSCEIIIFDLDGTLVDSGENISAAINHTRAAFGLEAMDCSFILDQINKDDINAAKVFYGTERFTEDQRAIFESYYYEICGQNISMYDKIDFYLEEFKKSGYKMAVATNGRSVFATKILETLGISEYFDFILGADNVALPKPSPEMLLKILDGFESKEGSNIVVVGDSIKDVKAAKAISAISVVAEWGFGTEKPIGDKNLQKSSELNWIIDFFKD